MMVVAALGHVIYFFLNQSKFSHGRALPLTSFCIIFSECIQFKSESSLILICSLLFVLNLIAFAFDFDFIYIFFYISLQLYFISILFAFCFTFYLLKKKKNLP